MTRLHDVMDEAAESYVPDGLAGVAIADAQRRRRSRFAVVAAAISVVGVVLAFVLVGQPFAPTSSELVTPAGVAPFPERLPTAADLPPLAEAPMASASAAYVVDGEVVLVNAKTGEAVTAFASAEDIPASLGGRSIDSTTLSEWSWSSVSLSPDGRQLMMTAPAVSDLFSSRALLYLLDVESGEVTRVTNLTLVSYRDEVGSLEPQLIAWSPSSASFACVCRYSTDRLPSVWVVELSTLLPGGRVNGVSGVARQQRQVVWGDGGIAAQRESGSWHHVHPGLGILIGLERASADQLALSINREAAYYLAVRSVTQYNSQVGTSEAVEYWIGTKGAVATAPRTMPGAATTVGAASDGFVLSLRRAQGELGGVGQLAPIDVVLVDAVGATSALTVLPAGSWSPTFAADLLG